MQCLSNHSSINWLYKFLRIVSPNQEIYTENSAILRCDLLIFVDYGEEARIFNLSKIVCFAVSPYASSKEVLFDEKGS
jgi:hypothetical protein